ncbi:MAG: preprotein translocase subunit YajC [Planctomycetota bacterium]|nr:preprotein translocase subunit YajC [Planctomycetota bacterium]
MAETLCYPVLISLSPVAQEPQAPPPGPNDQAGGAGPGGTTAPGQPNQQAPQGPGDMCGTETFLMMGMFLLLMWLMILRPESKRRKETQNMLSLLKQGDVVVTIGGMHGTVTNLTDKNVTLQVDGIQMLFDRTAIARVHRDEPAAPANGKA